MPKKHAGSHALATLLTMIAATLLATWLRYEFTSVMGFFDRISGWVLDIAPLRMSREMLTNIIFATFLSAIWGMGFFIMNKRQSE